MYSKFQAHIPHLKRGKSTSWKALSLMNDDLRSGGVGVTYVGSVGLNPFARRMHCKVTLVDDEIFTFGGVNFSDDMFINSDYMLQMHDTILADRLYRLVRKIEADEGPLPDLEELQGEEATLLFDGGTPKQSIIYDTACNVVKDASKVYYVSQMCPSGRLAPLLKKTDSTCYFIAPGQTDFPANMALISDQLRYRLKNSYTGTKYIHAKFILTIGKNGTKHIISGSNNFNWRGVKYGTKEIAVHATDPQLWEHFYQYMQQHIVHAG
jgi:hypothetical protein